MEGQTFEFSETTPICKGFEKMLKALVVVFPQQIIMTSRRRGSHAERLMGRTLMKELTVAKYVLRYQRRMIKDVLGRTTCACKTE